MKITNLFSALPLATRLLPLVLLFLANAAFAQTIPTASMYLGQQVPGITPKIFTLQVSPGLAAAERIVISADNKEIYYGELDNWPSSVQRIKCYKYSGTTWQGPFVVFDGYIAPSLSANDSIMYMQKMLNNNTLTGTFYSRRNGTGWTTPQRMLIRNRNSHYFQQTNLKNYFTASSPSGTAAAVSDLCKLSILDGDTIFQNLGTPVNTTVIENDFFIARDESYMIICRFPSGSASDLYISYKTENGRWTNPKTLGAQVNTANPNWEACPFVTSDNKYLFFMRGGNALSSYSIYWVSINNLIDSLRQTNFNPYVRYALQSQTISTGRSNNFAIPDSSFIDDNGNGTLTFAVALSNGNPLPSWLVFDADSLSFIGTPTETGSFSVKVTALDQASVSVSSTFSLRVIDASGLDEKILEPDIKVFPNPAKDKFMISFGTIPYSKAIVQVTNLIGEKVFSGTFNTNSVAEINLEGNPAGIYVINLSIDGAVINKRVILE